MSVSVAHHPGNLGPDLMNIKKYLSCADVVQPPEKWLNRVYKPCLIYLLNLIPGVWVWVLSLVHTLHSLDIAENDCMYLERLEFSVTLSVTELSFYLNLRY